jgi:hypothetical protein
VGRVVEFGLHYFPLISVDLTVDLFFRYNIVGDGTPAALFPILVGKNELELPDVRKKMKKTGYVDDMPFIFYKLRDDG